MGNTTNETGWVETVRACDVGGCSRWFPAATLQAALHFVSGINAPGEVRGLASNAFNIGITCGEIRTGLLEELAGHFTHSANGRVFVDSAAFSEVAFSPELGRLVTVKPLADADWKVRFDLYRQVARTYGRRAYVVAPDKVGDQAETLARLERYASTMRQIARAATVIVPVQKGALAMSAMFRVSCELLGIAGEFVVAGVPMMKDATSLEDLAELARSFAPGQRVHLLGIGPKAKFNRYTLAITAIRTACPTARITSDSAVLVSVVGRTNGRGNGPRALTKYQDDARTDGALPIGIKAIAISRWRKDSTTIEDAFDARALAVELGVG